MSTALISAGVQFPNGSIQTTAGVAAEVGMISMFDAGTTLPFGWHICDGTNGTPDLRDRFPIGGGPSTPAGNAGGSFTIGEANLPGHDHGGTTGTESQAHSHYMGASQVSISGGQTGGAGAHSHGVNDPGHAHGYTSWQGGSGTNMGGPCHGGVSATTTNATGIGIDGVGDHTHSFGGTVTISGTTGDISAVHNHNISSQGSSAPYYQPYYTLIFAKFTGV